MLAEKCTSLAAVTEPSLKRLQAPRRAWEFVIPRHSEINRTVTHHSPTGQMNENNNGGEDDRKSSLTLCVETILGHIIVS